MHLRGFCVVVLVVAVAFLPDGAWAQIRNPASIGAELDEIDAARQPRAPLPGLDALFKPWYDFKSKLEMDFGLQFGLAWTALYQVATSTLPGNDNQAAGGIFEFLGRWTFIDRKGDYPGTLGFRVENRHRLGTEFPPQSLGGQIGAATPTALGFSEFDLTLAELYYEQEIVKDRFGVRIGKMIPFAIYDFFYFKNPKTGYLNANFALNPTIAWPQFGLGAVTEIRPIEQIYLVVGIHDANGDPETAGFDTFFGDKEYFIAGEVGWDPGYLVGEDRNEMAPDVHATFWHTDARKKLGRPEGWGVSVTAQKAFGNIVPFARYGYSDGGAAALKHLVMTGVNWIDVFDYQQDTIGFAVSYAKPSALGSRSQFNAELYYRTQLTRRLALTPSIQLIGNPSATGQGALAVFGFRSRFDF